VIPHSNWLTGSGISGFEFTSGYQATRVMGLPDGERKDMTNPNFPVGCIGRCSHARNTPLWLM
jgi:hypothetical protein